MEHFTGNKGAALVPEEIYCTLNRAAALHRGLLRTSGKDNIVSMSEWWADRLDKLAAMEDAEERDDFARDVVQSALEWDPTATSLFLILGMELAVKLSPETAAGLARFSES